MENLMRTCLLGTVFALAAGTAAIAAPAVTVTEVKAPDLEARGIKPVSKTLVLNSDDGEGGLPKKIEGVAVMSPAEMIVLNDSDFGIEGDKNQIRRITFSEPVLQ